jgi:glutathione S-transferase
MSGLELIIGDKRFSSWSLRPWLALVHAGADFGEVMVKLRQPDTTERVLEVSPSGKIPALRLGDGTLVWDSLAVCEWVAEAYPAAGLWPADARARAVARSASAEMHSGFQALRSSMSMDVALVAPGEGDTPASRADIERIVALWTQLRAEFGAGGPYLFGQFTIADCMFAPVIFRFRSFVRGLPTVAEDYVAAMLAHPGMKRWDAAGKAEAAIS